MQDIAHLGLEVDSRPVDRASKDLDRLSAAAAKAERTMTGGLGRIGREGGQSMSRMERATDRARNSLTGYTAASSRAVAANDNVTRSVGFLRSAFIALGGTLAARFAVRAADDFRLLENRLTLLTGSTEGARREMALLFDVAQRTRSDIGATADTFVRLAMSTQSTGLSMDQTRKLVEGLNAGFINAGVRGNEASAAMIQLGQAFASGRLQGDELRSVMENLGPIGRDIAHELGFRGKNAVGDFRDAASEATITIEQIAAAMHNALLPQIDRLNDSVPTVGQAFTQMRNEMRLATAEAFNGEGASAALVDTLGELRDTVTSDGFQGGLTFMARTFAAIAESAAGLVKSLGDLFSGPTVEFLDTWARRDPLAGLILGDRPGNGEASAGQLAFAMGPGGGAWGSGYRGLPGYIAAMPGGGGGGAGAGVPIPIPRPTGPTEDEIKAAEKAQKEFDKARKAALEDIVKLEKDAAAAALEGIAALEHARDVAVETQMGRYREGIINLDEFARARLAIEEAFQKEKAKIEEDAAEKLRRELEREAERATEKRQREAEREAERQAEIMRRPFENAIDGIQDSFTNFFEDVLSGGVNSFKDLANAVKGIWIRMSAELASQNLMQRLIGGGSSTASAGLGTTSGAGAIGRAFSGLGSFFGIGGAASTGGGRAGGVGNPNVGGGFSSGAAGLSGAVAAIPVWGWIAAAAMTAKSFVEGSKPGSPQGVLDTLLLPSIDQWQNNPGRSAINALDPIGTAFGDVFGNDGPAGILGGLLIGPGAFLGNLFGKKPSVGPNAVSTLINRNGLLSGNAGRADNGGSAQGAQDFANAVAQAINAITGDLGATFPGISPFRVGSFGGQFRVGTSYNGGRLNRALGKDPQAAAEAAALYGFENFALEGIDPALASAVQRAAKISADLEDFAANIGVARAVLDETLFNAEEISQAEQALKDVAAAFEDAAERADRLGLSVAKVEELREQALRDLTEGFDEGIRAQILAITDPVTAALEAQAKTAERRLKDAETLGADLVEVERLNALERQRVLEQAGGGLNRFFEELTFGSLSGVSPGAGVEGSRAAFEAAVASGSIGEIERLGRGLVNTSREAFASGPQFQSDLARVTDVVGSYVTSNDNAINTYAAESLPLFHQMAASLAALEQRAARQEDEIRRLNNRLEANAA